MKKCTKCKKKKSVKEFDQQSHTKDGRRSSCKKCNAKKFKVICPDCGNECLKSFYTVKRRPRCNDCGKKVSARLNSKRMTQSTGDKNPNWKGGISKDNMSYRKRQIERFPEKEYARRQVKLALLRGDLVKKPCNKCGESKDVHAHHENYKKPLKVIWLCRKHHKERS